jgi:hypothetical protein
MAYFAASVCCCETWPHYRLFSCCFFLASASARILSAHAPQMAFSEGLPQILQTDLEWFCVFGVVAEVTVIFLARVKFTVGSNCANAIEAPNSEVVKNVGLPAKCQPERSAFTMFRECVGAFVAPGRANGKVSKRDFPSKCMILARQGGESSPFGEIPYKHSVGPRQSRDRYSAYPRTLDLKSNCFGRETPSRWGHWPSEDSFASVFASFIAH